MILITDNLNYDDYDLQSSVTMVNLLMIMICDYDLGS